MTRTGLYRALLLALSMAAGPAAAQGFDGLWTCRTGIAHLGDLVVSGSTIGLQTPDGNSWAATILPNAAEPSALDGDLAIAGIDGIWRYVSTDDRGSYPTIDLMSAGASVATCVLAE